MRGAPLQKVCRGRYPIISIRITSSSIRTTILFLFSMPVGRDVSLPRVSSLSLLRFMDAYCPEAVIILLPSLIWWGEPYRALYATADTVYGHQPCGTVTSRTAGCRAEPQTAYLEKPVYISDGQLWAKLREVSSDS